MTYLWQGDTAKKIGYAIWYIREEQRTKASGRLHLFESGCQKRGQALYDHAVRVYPGTSLRLNKMTNKIPRRSPIPNSLQDKHPTHHLHDTTRW